MAQSIADLLGVLDLERIEDNIFRGLVPSVGRRRVFGGLVVAQALVAAARTVEGRAPHSLHAYFVLPGEPTSPIVYEVERVRDGRSFTTRRCVAIQGGRPIFDLFASFQVEEAGLDHQASMPDVPDPDSLPSQAEIEARYGNLLPRGLKAWFKGERAIEVRLCDVRRFDRSAPPQAVQNVWIKAAGRLPHDPAIHRAVLAYLSDMTLIDVTLAAHGRSLFEAEFAVASLDHALWFHRPFRVDEWLLYAQDSPNTFGGRGLARGLLYDRSGTLVASVVQEGLIRGRPNDP
jgi:acyl-CoA thioesterase-2